MRGVEIKNERNGGRKEGERGEKKEGGGEMRRGRSKGEKKGVRNGKGGGRSARL